MNGGSKDQLKEFYYSPDSSEDSSPAVSSEDSPSAPSSPSNCSPSRPSVSSSSIEAPEGDFIAYEDLTQADVEAWLESKLVVEQLQAGLDAKLEAIKNPTHHTLNLVS